MLLYYLFFIITSQITSLKLLLSAEQSFGERANGELRSGLSELWKSVSILDIDFTTS